jgi:hypothetical protein
MASVSTSSRVDLGSGSCPKAKDKRRGMEEGCRKEGDLRLSDLEPSRYTTKGGRSPYRRRIVEHCRGDSHIRISSRSTVHDRARRKVDNRRRAGRREGGSIGLTFLRERKCPVVPLDPVVLRVARAGFEDLLEPERLLSVPALVLFGFLLHELLPSLPSAFLWQESVVCRCWRRSEVGR